MIRDRKLWILLFAAALLAVAVTLLAVNVTSEPDRPSSREQRVCELTEQEMRRQWPDVYADEELRDEYLALVDC